ncbi:MAG: hypothetical protein SFZ24_11115 [Planctomycetota bacterium]|nr:hypothetical protein [Planctomycetota bacterium]
MKRVLLIAGSGLAAVLGACQSSPDGVRIGDATLQQFDAGVTTEAWVRAILGDPTHVSVVEGVEDTRVLRYALTERKGGLAGLFTGSDPKTVSVVYFIVTDGTVTRYWADRQIERTLLGNPVESGQGEKEQ